MLEPAPQRDGYPDGDGRHGGGEQTGTAYRLVVDLYEVGRCPHHQRNVGGSDGCCVLPMAWKIPLADQKTSDRAKFWILRMNRTFISPLPTRPSPTRSRAPIRSAKRPIGTAESE